MSRAGAGDRCWTAEIGWRSPGSRAPGLRWTWDTAAFYARINDEILSIDDPNAPGNSLVTNIDSGGRRYKLRIARSEIED